MSSLNVWLLPLYMQETALAYVELGLPPGDFLRAVLENNLVEAFSRADRDNNIHMHDWAQWLYDLPRICWGSREKVDAWIKMGGMTGRGSHEASQP